MNREQVTGHTHLVLMAGPGIFCHSAYLRHEETDTQRRGSDLSEPVEKPDFILLYTLLIYGSSDFEGKEA